MLTLFSPELLMSGFLHGGMRILNIHVVLIVGFQFYLRFLNAIMHFIRNPINEPGNEKSET